MNIFEVLVAEVFKKRYARIDCGVNDVRARVSTPELEPLKGTTQPTSRMWSRSARRRRESCQLLHLACQKSRVKPATSFDHDVVRQPRRGAPTIPPSKLLLPSILSDLLQFYMTMTVIPNLERQVPYMAVQVASRTQPRQIDLGLSQATRVGSCVGTFYPVQDSSIVYDPQHHFQPAEERM